MARNPTALDGDDGKEAMAIVGDSLDLDMDDLDGVDDDSVEDVDTDEEPARESSDAADDSDDDGLDDMRMGADDTGREAPVRSDVSHTARTGELRVNTKTGKVVVQGTAVDKAGNIIDQASGRVIARAGAEARFYNDMNTAKYSAAQTNVARQETHGRLLRAVEIGTELAQKLQAIEEAGNAGTKLGLSAPEQLEAFQMFSEGKSNPTELLKKLLTRAAAAGIDMTKLGLQPGAVDQKSMLDLIREEIGKVTAPLSERNKQDQLTTQQQQEYAGRLQQTTSEVQEHFAQNPDMVPYLPVYMEIKKDSRFRHMPLGEIQARIKLNLLQQRGGVGNGSQQQRRARPNGRGAPSRDGSGPRTSMANPTDSYGDILNGILDEEGVPR